MQDRRVADIEDYGKLGLLRRICGCDGCFDDTRSLAVLWYRMPDDADAAPLPRPDYLGDPETFRACDSRLFDTLDEIVASGFRETNSIEIAELLGDVAFHSDLWSLESAASQQVRDVERRRLFLGALAAVGERQVVFVDADAGLMPDGMVPNMPGAGAWIGWDEIIKLTALRRTLVIRQPTESDTPVQRQGVRRAMELIAKLRLEVRPIPVVFQPGDGTLYFVIPAPDDVDAVQERLFSLVAGDDPWSRYFDILGHAPGG